MLDETDNIEYFIEKYEIQKFIANKSWILKFMNRNVLIFRKPHPEKRTEIRESEVDLYLNQLANTINKFGVNRIINMDETRINTFAPHIKTIARKR